jgi:hypothetical protein
MQTHMLKWRVVLMVALITAGVGVWGPLALAAAKKVKPVAPVPQTGQTLSYADGDDGDTQVGVAWPVPRFTDYGNGTVTDNLTALIWLQNANCFGFREWAPQALIDAGTLASGSCGLSDGSVEGDWRLPNVKELQSLIDFGFFNPALSNAVGTAKWTQADAFSGVLSGHYYSSTTSAGQPGDAWQVDLNDGFTHRSSKGFNSLVWPVRGGN